MTGHVNQKETALRDLRKLESEKKDELAQMEQRINNYRLQIDWAETLEKLLGDTPTVSNAQLSRLVDKLQLIIKARETVKGLPIDYTEPREEFVLLVQTVSAKKLVPREVFENETAELKEMNRALQFDRFGKHEREKREFLRMRLEFEAASEEKLLAMAASLVGKGEVHLMWCKDRDCRTGVAIRPGGDKFQPIDLYSCPRCKSLLYHISSSLPPKGRTVVVRRGF